MKNNVMPGAYASWESGPKDAVTTNAHCKCCVIEYSTADYTDFECPECGRSGVEGDLECGVCALCGVERTSDDPAWHIEGQDDMSCPNCLEG